MSEPPAAPDDAGRRTDAGPAGRAFDVLSARPRVTVAAMLLGAALGGWAAAGADVDFSPQSVLDGRDALVADMEAARRTFGYEDAVLLVLLQDDRPRTPGDADAPGVLGAAALAWQQRLAADLPALPYVQTAVGVTTLNTGRVGVGTLGRPVVAPLVPGSPEEPVTEDEAAWVREQLADGRADGLVSADRRTAAVLAPLDPAARAADKTREAVAAVNDYLAKNPPPGGLTAAVGGMPALRLAIIDGLAADTEFLFPLSGLLFLAAVGLAFRRPVGLLVPGLGVGCGLAWAAGLLAAGGTRFGILSNVLPVLLTVVGLAAAVHVLARFAEEAGRTADGPDARKAAARRAFVALVPATGLTLGTTAVGFGSLLAAGSDAVRAFAVQACVGLACLGLSTLAAFAALAPRLRPPREPGGHEFHPATVLGSAAARFPFVTLLAGGAVVAAGLYLGSGLRVESRMLETHDADHPAARSIRRVGRDLGGVIAVEVLLDADEPGRLLEPAVYRAVDRFAAAARRVPGVLSVRTYTDSLNRTAAGIRRAPGPPFEPPPTAAAARQARVFLERVSPGALTPFLTADAARGRVVARVADIGTAATLDLAETFEQDLARRFPPGGSHGVSWRLTGDGYVNAVGMDRFVRDFLWGLAGAVAIIFAAVGLLFRSVRAGLIAAGVNLAPLCVTLGWLRVRGLELNAGNAIVFAVGLGVAVDDTVHLLTRFREELGTRGGDVPAAVRATLAASGRAVALTTGLVACGVAVLLFSEFVPTRRFAELVCVTLAAALAGDLTLLPAALTAFWPRKS